MAELPELAILQRQMDADLKGRVIRAVEVTQPKCLNVEPGAFAASTVRRTIAGVSRRGKWLLVRLEPECYVLLNLGMGAELWRYAPGDEVPAKYQLRVDLDDGSGFTCRFWWFGYIRLVEAAELPAYPELAKLGPDPLEITAEEFTAIARRYPRKPVKAMILDQDKVAGVGNAYAHDILWTAKLHPGAKVAALTDGDLARLHAAVCQVLCRAMEMGGLEPDFHHSGGNMSNWDAFSLIGYKEGRPCPACGTAIAKVKTGSTATYICPACQRA